VVQNRRILSRVTTKNRALDASVTSTGLCAITRRHRLFVRWGRRISESLISITRAPKSRSAARRAHLQFLISRSIQSTEDHLGNSYSALCRAFRSPGKVTLLSRPPSHPRPMNYTFGKKPGKSKPPKPSQKHIHLGIPINIAVGPLGFRAELDTDPKGDRNRSYRDSEPQIDGSNR